MLLKSLVSISGDKAGYSTNHTKLNSKEQNGRIFFFFEVYLIYNVVLSAVQQSESVTHTHTHILFYSLFHYGLPLDFFYLVLVEG